MLNLNSVLVVFFITLGAYLLNTLKEKDADLISQTTDSLLTTTFMLYADSLAAFKQNHPAHTGVVTTRQLPLPHWLARNTAIRTAIYHGTGYVYMPSKAALYESLMVETERSSMIGLTKKNQLMTASGVIPKPAFIPDNSIVYMR